MDAIDRKIIHALAIEPRVPFRTLADIIEVSDQTVARRYRRLRETGGLRISGRVNGERAGWVDWFMRLTCTPGSAGAIAAALSRRGDTRWVQLSSGGTEVVCVVQARTPEQRDNLLLEGIPNSRRVVQISAHSLLHTFSGPVWPMLTSALDDTQLARLHGPASPQPSDEAAPLALENEPLLSQLARDGRTSTTDLAAAIGWHESSVRRRIAELLQAGTLYFDVDIDERVLGMNSNALLWISARPDQLDATGHAMATHPEVPFVAAITGTCNLLAAVVCRDERDLYDYLAHTVGQLPGIRDIETAPLIRTFKRVGSLLGTGR